MSGWIAIGNVRSFNIDKGFSSIPVSTLKREERAFLGKREREESWRLAESNISRPPVGQAPPTSDQTRNEISEKPRCDAHTGSTVKEHISLFIEEVAGEKDTLRSFICKLFL